MSSGCSFGGPASCENSPQEEVIPSEVFPLHEMACTRWHVGWSWAWGRALSSPTVSTRRRRSAFDVSPTAIPGTARVCTPRSMSYMRQHRRAGGRVRASGYVRAFVCVSRHISHVAQPNTASVYYILSAAFALVALCLPPGSACACDMCDVRCADVRVRVRVRVRGD